MTVNLICYYPRKYIRFNILNISGGVEDYSGISTHSYWTGLTGCIAELSIGNMINIDMLHTAERGGNIDSCSIP